MRPVRGHPRGQRQRTEREWKKVEDLRRLDGGGDQVRRQRQTDGLLLAVSIDAAAHRQGEERLPPQGGGARASHRPGARPRA